MPEQNLDLSDRVDALERRVTHVEATTEVVTAIRADMATIAQDVDPRLTEHVAELDDGVEKHALLIGRLLEVTPMARRRENE
jgi:hypothetical protein